MSATLICKVSWSMSQHLAKILFSLSSRAVEAAAEITNEGLDSILGANESNRIAQHGEGASFDL